MTLRAMDRNRHGTYYTDRMHHILSVCHDCGVLWHDERVTFRNGVTDTRRVDDVTPEGTVLVTPQYERYGLRVNPRLLPRLKAMGPQFAYALNVPNARVEVDGGIVFVVIPRPFQAGNILTFDEAWKAGPDMRPGWLLLGKSGNDQIVLDMSDPRNVHAAVIGMSGSGKSTLMKTMILSALRIGKARVALFDPTRDFTPLSGHPMIWRGGLFATLDECELGLDVLAATIGRKSGELLFVFVDEVPDLVLRRPRIGEYLTRLAKAGRHAGIHLILGAQRMTSETAGSSMAVANIPVRLVGHVSSKGESFLATGQADMGCETLRSHGDFLAVNGLDHTRFQAAIIPDEQIAAWAERFPPRVPRLPVSVNNVQVDNVQLDNVQAQNVQTGNNGGGRPLDEIPAVALDELEAYVQEHGKTPSTYWIDKTLAPLLAPGQRYVNPQKRQRIIEIAESMLPEVVT